MNFSITMNTITLLGLLISTRYIGVADYLKSVLAEEFLFFRENMFRSLNIKQINAEVLWLRSGW